MKKAKSRLGVNNEIPNEIIVAEELKENERGETQSKTTHPKSLHQDKKVKFKEKARGWLWNYVQFLPWLVGSLFFYFLTYLLMVNIRPQQIANLLMPDSYLPFQILVAMGNFMIATFLWQNKARGLWTMCFLNGLLFLHLQRIVITPLITTVWLGPWLFLTIWSFKKKKQKQ